MNEMITLDPEEAAALSKNVQLLGSYISKMAGIIKAMGERIDLLEAERGREITIRHADAKAITYLIKEKGETMSEKYDISDPKKISKIRSEIRKSILKAYGITDIHDLPSNALDGARKRIENYANIRLIMKLKDSG